MKKPPKPPLRSKPLYPQRIRVRSVTAPQQVVLILDLAPLCQVSDESTEPSEQDAPGCSPRGGLATRGVRGEP